ncbi:hypothetical protein Rin_00005930 [Candidatus Regiella insecticola 5.15]|uniref:Uncharacterized protein n=1 Tax=Candidatus Regiella insecticola 5.15 TaxID=1005043 RepID=G2GXU9_9ENTR|nr:hypothetical protein [Candidatus Regiella insecticola]EGY29429.1 hypothetical protein Rin_00005930 [Candidatus Regiella insecticola 5.15]
MNFELRQGGKGGRPMSVDLLRDSASTRRQQSRNLKGEGYRLAHNLTAYCSQLQLSLGAVIMHRSISLFALPSERQS